MNFSALAMPWSASEIILGLEYIHGGAVHILDWIALVIVMILVDAFIKGTKTRALAIQNKILWTTASAISGATWEMITTHPCPFGALPNELLVQIVLHLYDKSPRMFAFPYHQPHFDTETGELCRMHRNFRQPPSISSLMLTCKRMHDVAGEAFYSTVEFHIRFRTYEPIAGVPSPRARWVHTLKLHFQHRSFEHWFGSLDQTTRYLFRPKPTSLRKIIFPRHVWELTDWQAYFTSLRRLCIAIDMAYLEDVTEADLEGLRRMPKDAEILLKSEEVEVIMTGHWADDSTRKSVPEVTKLIKGMVEKPARR